MPSTHLHHWIAQQNVIRYKRLIEEAPTEEMKDHLRLLLKQAEAQVAEVKPEGHEQHPPTANGE